MSTEHRGHFQLPILGRIDEPAQLIDKKIDPVRPELSIGEGPADLQRLAHVIECFSHFSQGNAVDATDGGQNVCLDKVEEGQPLVPIPIETNERLETPGFALGDITLTKAPGAQRAL